MEFGDSQSRLRACLEKVAEVEGLLARVNAAEATLANVRQVLADVCAGGAGGCPRQKAPPASRPRQEAAAPGMVRPQCADTERDEVPMPTTGIVDQIVLETLRKPHDAEAEVWDMHNDEVVCTLPHTPAGRPPPGSSSEPHASVSHEEGSLLGVRFPMVILHPNSRLRLFWELLGLCFIIYETYAIPFSISFQIHPTGYLFVLISFINTYFLVDILLTFMTGYKKGSGAIETKPELIARKYVHGCLFADILAGIPWEWLEAWTGRQGTVAQLTKMLRLLRIARLLRLLRQDIVTDRFKMLIDASPLLVFTTRILGLLFVLFSITHWSACIWYVVGAKTSGENETTWLDKMNLRNDTLEERYVYALYFTLTTMTTVGYGDITPQNYVEVCFVTVLLLIATVVFAALMGSLTDLISSLNNEKNVQREKVLMLSRYMSWRGVPRTLFLAVRQHLLYFWETNGGYDAYENEVKEQLPPVLRKELCHHIYGGILRTVPFFAWLRGRDVVLRDMADIVQQNIWSRGDRLFKLGQANEHIYVLLSGSVRTSMNESLFSLQAWGDSDDAHPENGFDAQGGASDFFEVPKRTAAGLAASPQHVVETLRTVSHGFTTSMSSWQVRPGAQLPASACQPHSAPASDHGGKGNFFRAFSFQEAASKLMQQDMREKWAARYIQRRWKQKLSGVRRPVTKRSTIHTMSVTAPAYFGESCLWVPLEEWTTAVPHNHSYSARCETRCELVTLARSDIKDIIDHFSPWLADRFEFFRQAVTRNMLDLAGHPSGPPSTAGDTGSLQARRLSASNAGNSRSGSVFSANSATSAKICPKQALDRTIPQQAVALAGLQLRWADLASRSRAEASRLAPGPPPGPSFGRSLSSRSGMGYGSAGSRTWSSLRTPLLGRPRATSALP